MKGVRVVSRGKKTEEEVIVKIFTLYAANGSYSQTARELDMATNTVKGIIVRNKKVKKYAKLLDNKRESFAKSAEEIIDKGMELLNRRFNVALNNQADIEFLFEQICEKCELDEKELIEIKKKLDRIQISSVAEIVRAVGVLYDKKALAKDEATENVVITVGLEE